MMIESLESRRLFNIAVSGGAGHVGIVLDVHQADDDGGMCPPSKIIGKITMDYYLAGWFGETAGTEGSSSGDLVGVGQARVMYQWVPGTGIGGGIPTTTVEDGKLLYWVFSVIDGPDPSYIRWPGRKGYSYRTNVPTGDFDTYRVTQCNCYTFAALILQGILSDRNNGPWPAPVTLPATWDGLREDLNYFLAHNGLPGSPTKGPAIPTSSVNNPTPTGASTGGDLVYDPVIGLT